MHLSQFNLEIPNTLTPSEVLLFNTMDGALISVPRDDYSHLKESLSRGTADPAGEDIAVLSELGFIETEMCDIKSKIRDWFSEVQNDTTTFNLVVATTLACNFACPYCVQGETHPVVSLNLSMCEDIIRFIRKEYAAHPFEELMVTYYGGEPLLNMRALRFFQERLPVFCSQHDVAYRSHLITNGSLLSRFAHEIEELGIHSLKITLDGTPEYHDRFRYYTNGKPSFSDIIKGIEQLSDRIELHIGSNFCDANYEGIRALPHYLSTTSIFSKIRLYNGKPVGSPQKVRLPGSHKPACRVYTDKVIERWSKLLELAEAYGLRARNLDHQGPCDYYRKRNVTVAPDGKLYPCPSFIGLEEDSIGSVYDAEPLLEKCPDMKIDDYCEGCGLLPLCAGGCRYVSKLCLGSREYLNCEKKFYSLAIGKQALKHVAPEEIKPALAS